MSEDWTPLQLVQWTAAYFEKAGIPNPRLDAELLLAHTLKVKRIDLYTDHERLIKEKELARYKAWLRRRATREPLQYLLGETEFYGLKFRVTPAVLIPRPETELLVEEAIKAVNGGILEIGTGSGCIAVAIAKNLPKARIVATDISKEALEIARTNAQHHEVADRVEFILADIAPWKRFTAEGRTFDLIVSNPPYIPTGEFPNLQPEVRDFEPRRALDGGPDGLDFYRSILQDAVRFLQEDGRILLEIGENQKQDVVALMTKTGLRSIEVKKDLNGRDRIIVGGRMPWTK